MPRASPLEFGISGFDAAGRGGALSFRASAFDSKLQAPQASNNHQGPSEHPPPPPTKMQPLDFGMLQFWGPDAPNIAVLPWEFPNIGIPYWGPYEGI